MTWFAKLDAKAMAAITATKFTSNDSQAIEAFASAFQSKVFTTLKGDEQLNSDNKCSEENKTAVVDISSLDSLGDTTCKPLKAAKQTKTQRQQNKRRRGEALAATSKVNAANDDDDNGNDDDDDSTNNNINNDGNSNNNNNNITSNSHTKSNANNRCCSRLSQSSRHSINQQRWRETDHKQHPRGREETPQTPSPAAPTKTRTPKTLAGGRQSDESHKINKSTKKLMNEVHSEDQIDKELPNANEEDMEEEKQQQKQQRHRHRERLSEKREQTYATQLLQKRTAAAAAKSQQFENHDDGFSCPSTHSPDYTHPYIPPALDGSSSSDSEGGHNPKLKKHLLNQYNSTGGGGISYRLLTSQSFSNSPHCRQLYTQAISRNATNAVASTLTTLSPPPTNSLHCLARQRGRSATTSTKSNMQRKKRDPAAHPPPAPSVTPSSSSDHLRDNNKIRETPRQKLNDDDNNNFRLSLRKDSQRLESLIQLPIEELKIPLTANVSYLMSMRTLEETLPSPESFFDESANGGATERGNLKLDSSEFRHNALPLYTNNSPYNNPEDTSRRLRPLPAKELQKLKPKPPTKKNSTLLKENRSPITQLETPNTNNISKQHDEELRDTKPDLHFDEMIRERNQFLELCEKNRYYNNPNYAEPWKVFSIISERLLNEVMDTVENDFDAGVSKFVEDFLALETRTQ